MTGIITKYLTIRRGEVSDFPRRLLERRGVEGVRFTSANACVVSALYNNEVVGNGPGRTTVTAFRDGRPVVRLRVTVKDASTEGKAVCPVLVNRWNRVPRGFAPADLVTVEKGAWNPTRDILACRCLVEDFNAMRERAAGDGVFLQVNYCYRSPGEQRLLLEKTIREKGREKAMKLGAPPYFSEHHTGLAMDVTGWVDDQGQRLTAPRDAQIWMAEHCHEYGFMIKNLQGKEAITGTVYEPWHIRYVGDRTAAARMHDERLTMDEYILAYCGKKK